MRKSCLPAGIEPAAFGLPKAVDLIPEQWTGNRKAAGSIPAGGQLFRIACFK